MNFFLQANCAEGVTSDWAGPEPFSTFPKPLDANLFLEGPYDSGSDAMTTDLSGAGYVPLSQPYQAHHGIMKVPNR